MMAELSFTASGAEVAAAIRRAAADRGADLTTFVASLYPKQTLGRLRDLERAGRPKPETIRRVRALLAGEGPSVPPPNRSTESSRAIWLKGHAENEARIVQDRAAVLAVLTEAADAGAPCPLYVEIERRVGISRHVVRPRINDLVDEGTIRFEPARRIVTIVATGRSTAPAAELVAAAIAGANTPAAPPPTPKVFDREPCFRCGIRGDIGCVHRPLEMRI